MRFISSIVSVALFLGGCVGVSIAYADVQDSPSYVGAQACADCHEEQYTGFQKNSSMARSWKSLEKMLPKLTAKEKEDCYSCHTTGYKKPGGFVDQDSTPQLANISCEVCHGPGSLHAASGDPADIQRKPDIDHCRTCHNEERVNNFKFKPMLYYGGH